MNEGTLGRLHFETQGRAGASAVKYGGNRILCRALNQFKMFVSATDETVGPHIALDGIWEPWVTAAVHNNLAAGMNCFNVGANVGYFTLLIASRVMPRGKVWAFECNPEMFELCKTNILLNGFDKFTTVLQVAGGEQPGTQQFAFDATQPGNGHVIRDFFRPDWETRTVNVDTVDRVLGNESLDFLMVDAEGSEPQVVAGAEQVIKKNPKMTMLLEWAPQGYEDPEKFAERILSMDFVPYRVGFKGQLIKISEASLHGITTWDMIWFMRG